MCFTNRVISLASYLHYLNTRAVLYYSCVNSAWASVTWCFYSSGICFIWGLSNNLISLLLLVYINYSERWVHVDVSYSHTEHFDFIHAPTPLLSVLPPPQSLSSSQIPLHCMLSYFSKRAQVSLGAAIKSPELSLILLNTVVNQQEDNLWIIISRHRPHILWPLSCSLSQKRSMHHAQPPGSTHCSLWSFWIVLTAAFSISYRHTHTSKARIRTMLSTMYPSLLHLPVLWTAAILLSLKLWKVLVPLPSGTGQVCWRQLQGAEAGLICIYLPWLVFISLCIVCGSVAGLILAGGVSCHFPWLYVWSFKCNIDYCPHCQHLSFISVGHSH